MTGFTSPSGALAAYEMKHMGLTKAEARKYAEANFADVFKNGRCFLLFEKGNYKTFAGFVTIKPS